MSSWDLKEEEFHHNVSKVLHSVAENIAKFNGTELPKKDLIKKRSSNYYTVNVNSAIDANILEDYLVRGFTEASITTDFEYAVYDCSNDEYVYSNYCNLSEQQDKGESIESHPKFNDLIYYFVVKFPSRSGNLINDLKTPILFSILTILSVIAFMYALWVILRQKQVTDLQTDFINNMTHEFKTPISSIKIAADYLQSQSLINTDERLNKYTSIIKDQNQRLNEQVEKVLNLVKLEKDQFKLNKTTFNLSELINEVIAQEKMKFEHKGGEILYTPSSEKVEIRADKLHLTNVLSNILDNAFKYCTDNPHAKVELRNKTNALQLRIQDQGIGINTDDMKKIFNKFYRISTGNVHNVKGFGLGLYYVKSICDAHGWTINLDSVPDKGTTVIIDIPKKKL